MSLETYTFKNGFRVIHQKPNNKLGVCAIQVFLNFGSAHETDDTRGMAHFIEHMCFKGTKTIPIPTDLFIKQDNAGGTFNANTNQRYTAYVCKIIDQDIANTIPLLANMMLHSTFVKKEFVKEENVVIEECLRSADNPVDLLEDDSASIVYDGSSYQHSIDKLAYHRKKYNYATVVDLYRLFYRPDNMILSIVSDVPFRTILNIVAKSDYAKSCGYSKKDLLDKRRHILYYSIPAPREIQYNFHEKPGLNTTHVKISFITCNQFHEDRYVLNMLEHVLGGLFGSKLSILLREKNGLTYTSTSNTEYHEHSGDISIYAQVNKHKVIRNGDKPGLLPLIIWLLNDLIKHGVTAEELSVAKRNKKAKLHLALDGLETQAEYNGKEWLLLQDPEKIIPINKIYDVRFKPVTRTQIHGVLRKYIKKNMMTVCFVGEEFPSRDVIDRECRKLMG